MKLEDQVCNWELAKQLKELSVKQESLFYWIKNPKHFLEENKKWICFYNATLPSLGEWYDECVSAFTVSELGKLLSKYNCYSKKTHSGWECRLINYIVYANTEADVRAKMLIHLISIKESKEKEINRKD